MVDAQNNSTILFIGNSLTYTNNLPQLVKKEAKKKGVKIKSTVLAKPNYAIVDHLNEGSVQKKLKAKNYDYIIIQQGPSSQPEGKKLLIESGIAINALIKGTKTKLVYFMVWPSMAYYQTFDGVIKNHKDAAKLNNALLCPVGEEWKQHFDATKNFDYYGPDGFHPSLKGSKKAAEIIVKTLF
ncbi:SGNH/GDSL hydrolase family protein [Urechidicola vernalis]|uniref:SGNH/GDSL hydrolase family protein n=1 Tax=Urechidicola vernalis TaxID=3075600 RepID=A0ABU2Y7V2_9FLAO|nr:SGNH/GDSL hydrolase family protein [Urechidicola sp. P050]MDT0554271.1 SGNH/GDSL hydrolase family protein [Urechidicola sp. P050]